MKNLEIFADYQFVKESRFAVKGSDSCIVIPPAKKSIGDDGLVDDYEDDGEKKVDKMITREHLVDRLLANEKEIKISRAELINCLQKADKLWIEAGGAGTKFVVACMNKEMVVNRIPTHQFKERRNVLLLEHRSLHLSILSNEDSIVPDLPLHISMLKTADSFPDDFYTLGANDDAINRLQILARSRMMIMERMRKPSHLRLLNIMRDLELYKRSEDEALTNEVVRESYAIRFLLQPQLKRHERMMERLNKISSLSSTSEEAKKYIKMIQTDAERDIKFNVDNPLFAEAVRAEEAIEKEMEKVLKEIPIFNEFFSQIKGLAGPAIAGMIIGEIGNIRRFPTPAALLNYSGWGLKQNAETQAYERQMRKHGQVDSNNKWLKQSLYLAVVSIIKLNPEEKAVYDGFKARLLEAHPEPVMVPGGKEGKMVKRFTKGHLDKMARRKWIRHFITNMWKKWTRMENPASYDKWEKETEERIAQQSSNGSEAQPEA